MQGKVASWSLFAACSLSAAGCGCNDIGCSDGIELRTPNTVIQLDVFSRGLACSVATPAPPCSVSDNGDGTLTFTFADVAPSGSVEVRLTYREIGIGFQGTVPLTLREHDPGDACDGPCTVGEASVGI